MLNPAKYIAYFFRSTPVFIVFSIFIIMTAMAAGSFFPGFLGKFNENYITSFAFIIIYSFIVFFIIPAITSKYIFKEPLHDIGLTFPKNNIKTLILIVIALTLLAPSIYLLTKQPGFQQYYSLKQTSATQLFLMTCSFPLYYFSEEFFFRGFLFLSLWKRVRWHSFWITDVMFTLAHISKPGMEILLCIPASVVFNCLTLATRSFYPAIIAHTILGVLGIILVNIDLIKPF